MIRANFVEEKPFELAAILGNIDMMKSLLPAAVVLLALSSTTATACPMCKAANEAPQPDGPNAATTDPNLRPRAYMYSIFFMMGMPVVAGGGIALAIRRDVNRAHAADDSIEASA